MNQGHPSRRRRMVLPGIVLAGLMLTASACGSLDPKPPAAPSRFKLAAERFNERCKGAGAKIYRTVDDVEGLMLLKIRPKLAFKDYKDPMLPGAARKTASFGWPARSSGWSPRRR